MKKKLFVSLVVIMVLSMISIPAVAGPPDNAQGTWVYAPVTMEEPETVGCNMVILMTDAGTFGGTFEGTETEDGMLVVHCNGRASYKGNLSFAGTVNGESGTMEMRIVGTSTDLPWFEAWWQGTWVILSGTDGLATLRGQGTWEGYLGSLAYEGNYHFEP